MRLQASVTEDPQSSPDSPGHRLGESLEQIFSAAERTGRELRALTDEARSAYTEFTATATELGRNVRALYRGATETATEVATEASVVGNALSRLSQDASRELTATGAHARRLVRTATALGHIAAAYRLNRIRSGFVSKASQEHSLQALHETSAKRYRQLSEEHGGGLLKLGQLLSSRPDLLPESWIRELSPLQDSAPSVEFEAIVETVEHDLKARISDLFVSFDETPIAAASIGQVHAAVTKDGRAVAVKVQRPGIRRAIEADIQVLHLLLESLRDLLPPMDETTVLRELSSSLREELNYHTELQNMSALHRFFLTVPKIRVPAPVPELSGPRVLTAEYMQGVRFTTALDELKADSTPESQSRIDQIFDRVLHAYLAQILKAGVFQADPHPGNLLVSRDGTLILLDFGCTGRMTEATRNQYVELLMAFITRNFSKMESLFDGLGFRTQSGGHETLHEFARAILQQLSEAASGGEPTWPDRTSLETLARDLLDCSNADPVVQLPPEFILLSRVFGTLGGLFNHYRPKLRLQELLLTELTQAMTPPTPR